MEVSEVIKNRRSIRRYQEKKVSWADVSKILDAGRNAASAGNVQNWQFIVVTDKKRKDELATASLRQYWMNEAPVHIVICNKLEKVRRLYGSRGEKLYSIQNCAAAAQNMLLRATDLGLASCWVGAFDENAVARILKLPDDVIPEIIITIGYADERIVHTPIKTPLDNITFFEEWGKRERDYELWPIEKHVKKVEKAVEEKRNKVRDFFKRFVKK